MTEKQDTRSEENGHTGGEKAIVPIEVRHPEKVEVEALRLFREPPWMLRLSIAGDRSYIKVKVVRAAPLSYAERYISFLDSRDEEICMVDDLRRLDEQTQAIVRQELERRYLSSRIECIHSVRSEFGTSYWDVETHRGRREFVVQNAAETAQWLSAGRVLLIDVDGNRFEIEDLEALDRKSARFVEQVL